jgi:hypothetical protein
MTRTLPAALLLSGLFASEASAREPLPTIEVVEPKKKRVRLIDVRGPLQFGWGYSTLWRTPVYEINFDVHAAFVEITESTWLHLVYSENFILAAYPVRGHEKTPSMLGLDLGVGLSRYATGGPGFFVSVTGGPRWMGDGWRPDGAGIVGRADVYPFYMTVKEIIAMEKRWFRKYVLSSVHVWASARYEYTPAAQGNTFGGGIGLDVGRTLMLPIIERIVR